jgi:hypothetical protein
MMIIYQCRRKVIASWRCWLILMWYVFTAGLLQTWRKERWMGVAFSMELALEMVRAMVQTELPCACTRWDLFFSLLPLRSECLGIKRRISPFFATRKGSWLASVVKMLTRMINCESMRLYKYMAGSFISAVIWFGRLSVFVLIYKIRTRASFTSLPVDILVPYISKNSRSEY